MKVENSGFLARMLVILCASVAQHNRRSKAERLTMRILAEPGRSCIVGKREKTRTFFRERTKIEQWGGVVLSKRLSSKLWFQEEDAAEERDELRK